MEKLTSILVVANRTAADRTLLEKAVALARNVGARIDLFSCDAELARRLRHSYPTEEAEKVWNICLAEHITYLRRLQADVSAPDVQISVDAACHSPLHEGIVSKIRETGADRSRAERAVGLSPKADAGIPCRGEPRSRAERGSGSCRAGFRCGAEL